MKNLRLAQSPWLIALALFAASLALYARTMAPGLLDGDEGEFQTNLYRLGVSHTGYPTFFLLGKLFTLLDPIGSIAARENLYAGFWGALAVAAVFVIVYFLTRSRGAAIFSALLLLVSRVEWSQSVIPRPYTLNSFFVVLVVLFFFLWRIGKVDLTVPVFVFGLSLTNHRTMIWFAPAIAVFILSADYRAVCAEHPPHGNIFALARQWLTSSALFKPQRILTVLIAFVVPLLLYGYVFWRGDSDVGVEFHMKDFSDMILAGNADRWMRYGPLDWLVRRVTDLYIPLLIEQFSPLGFILGLVGMLALMLDRPPRQWLTQLPAREAFLFIALVNLGNSVFCFFFQTMDVEKYFIPSYITFLFFIGVGMVVVWDWLAERFTRTALRLSLQAILGLALVSVCGYLIVHNYPLNDWSGRTDVQQTWDENLALPLEQHALIVGPWESLTPLEYSWYVEGRRTDLERWKVITVKDQLPLTLYGSRQQDIEQQVRAGRPVYLTVHPNDTETLGALADEFRIVRVASLWRVLNLPSVNCKAGLTDCRLPATALGIKFTDQAGQSIELAGYAVYPSTTLRPGDFGMVTLFWRAPESISTRLTVSFRLSDSQDRIVYQRDAEPGNGLRPTIGWAPDEIVQDDIGFFAPADAAAGIYRLAIVVYNPATLENLKTTSGTVFTVDEINVESK